MKTLKNFLTILMVTPLIFACSDEDSARGTTTLNISLIDAPGDYQEVNVDIQSVEINMEGSDSTSGWETLDLLEPGIYNLLDFTNGNDTLLVSQEVEVGKISQIRLILGNDNTVKVDDVVHDLKTPSGQQSGLKLKVNADLTAGITYSMVLDFDAARSVVKAGNSGNYNLKPVIRVLTEAVDGGVMGVVAPDTISAAVYAISGDDTVGTMTADDGAFKILGLAAGTYDIVAAPEDSIDAVTLMDVPVSLGVITDVDTIFVQ